MTPVRTAGPPDLEALLPLIAEFCAIDGHAFDEQVVRRALAPLLADASLGFVLVDDALTAYVVVTWGYSLEAGGREALVDEFYVRERSHGLGGRLLNDVVARARAAGAFGIFLETERANTGARRFYARHGFAAEDSVWMQLRLNQPG